MSKREKLDLPKHKNPVDDNACAPYNFVPLPEKVVLAVDEANDLPDHDTFANEGFPHTGYFEVTMETKSPLYIRCPLTRDEFDLDEQDKDRNGHKVDSQTRFADRIKNTPHFFYTSDPIRPVIPSSSLRGMLRGLLEIVSYSKVQWVTDKKLFFRTMDDSVVGKYYRGRMTNNVEAGFLRKQGNRFFIKKCQMARVWRDDLPENLPENLYEGRGPNKTPRWNDPVVQHRQIWVHLATNGQIVQRLDTKHQSDLSEGRLVITGDMQNKRKEFVFLLPSDDTDEIIVSEQMIERFHDDDQLTQWQEKAFHKDKPTTNSRERSGTLNRSLQGQGEPVFFLRENGELTFFGRAQMFRLPYTKHPLDLAPVLLRRPEVVDYAEAIFGFVLTQEAKKDMKKRGIRLPDQGDKAHAYASRVFVTGATVAKALDGLWLSDKAITPKILATPKPTAFQHYLTQQQPNRKRELDHYDSPPPHNTTIRGHKLYWHQGDRTAQQLQPDSEYGELEPTPTSTQHTQFKPVKSGVSFSFRIYFENLSDEELGALCWALHPLGDDKKDYCHSLGMGKPFGMGAVKLDAVLHLNKREERYGSLFNSKGWATGFPETGQRLDDRGELVKKFTDAFETRILEDLKPFQKDGQSVVCSKLADLKRIGMLLKMMEWPGFPAKLPATRNNRSETPEGKPNTRYMTIELNGVPSTQKNEYKDRPVLPDPSADIFGGLTGYAEPSTNKDEPSVSEPHKSDSKSAGEEDKSKAKLPLVESKQSVSKEMTNTGDGKDKSLTNPTIQTDAQSEKSKPSQEAHPATLNILEDLKKTAEEPRQEQTVKTVTSESVVLIAYINQKKARVRTEQGEEIECAAMPNYPKLQANDLFFARVTRQNGNASNAVFDGWK